MNSPSSGTSPTPDWLPRTKLSPSPLDDNSLVRHRLLPLLHNAICTYRLTLLSAPTGYGKSTLLNSWLQAAQDWVGTPSAVQAAYLSLDAAENDRAHFLLALIAALQTLHPACGQRAQTFLTQNGYPEAVDAATQIQILTGLIVIDLAQYLPQRFVLILDNYERISEPTVHSALNYLLRRLPSQAHVVVSTTQDPLLSLAKLRAHGLATIIRAETLAYDEDESAAFLDKVAELPLPPAQQLALHRYAEGWPMGLCLLAQDLQSLPHTSARIQLIASLNSGQDPPAIWPAVEGYLREEIFDDLPRSLRTFLMQTSILATLRADICQKLTGAQDAAELLQTIYQRNLFLLRHTAEQTSEVRTDASYSPPLFRYHTLFAAFLQRRLHHELPDQVTRLHRQAAAAVAEPVEKVRHYLAARCWTEATEVLSSSHKHADWPAEKLAKLARATDEMPPHLRHLLNARRSLVLPANGHIGLTERQFEVLLLLDHGASNHAIATELFITLATVKGHIGEIMRKLQVRSRREAVRRAAELGLLSH